MEQRHLGRSGLLVSRLALGTLTWGRDTDEDDAAAALAAFRDAGGTLVDTADRYGDGAAEAMLGRLLDKSDRDDVVLATSAGSPRGAHGAAGSRRNLLATLDESLDRLGTPYVDLWQVPGWDATTPLEETLAALDAAVTSGRARYAGVGNYAGWQLAKAATWQAAFPGRTPIVSTQLEYSLLQRGAEREALPACADLGIGVLAWSPLGRGVLTGKYSGGIPADSRAASDDYKPFVRPYLTDDADRVVDAVLTAADGLGVPPVAVALAWVRDRPGVASALVGARTPGQLAAALATEEVVLPASILAALDDISTPYAGYPERPPALG